MTLYFDSSALAKLVVAEAESEPLRGWLGQHQGVPIVTNSVGVVELQRLAGRIGPAALAVAVLLLGRVGHVQLTPASMLLAAQLPPADLRSLDALHIGSAAMITDLLSLVTYDHRIATAAAAYGLPVTAPGG